MEPLTLTQNSLPAVYCLLGRSLNGGCLSYGTDDLGKMMMACHSHKSPSSTVTTPPPRIPQFATGWEACEKVWAKWLVSEEARRQREYQEKTESERQSVIEFAKGL